MEFEILGALQVKASGREIPVTAPKQQAALAALLLSANCAVSADEMVEHLWSGQPPAAARSTLQAYIHRLRQLLSGMPGEVRLSTSTAGYTLELGSARLDLRIFHERVGEARHLAAAGDLSDAAVLLRGALSLWRGAALAGVPGDFIQEEARFLDAERIAAHEELLHLEMRVGNHQRIIPELIKLCNAHPFREAITAQLMVCLYRCGRQAEALRTFSQSRKRLREELGIEPGVDLQELQKAILTRVPVDQITLRSCPG